MSCLNQTHNLEWTVLVRLKDAVHKGLHELDMVEYIEAPGVGKPLWAFVPKQLLTYGPYAAGLGMLNEVIKVHPLLKNG